MELIRQAVKYGAVGIVNTLLTLVVIWSLTKNLGCSEPFANFVGYVVGLVCSFFLNRQWTFHSKDKMWRSGMKFLAVFAVCYLLQLGVLLLLNRFCPSDPPLYSFFEPILAYFHINDSRFYIQMLSMVFYTVVNFLVNKYYTFKR